MKKRSFLQLVLVVGLCGAAFACGWVGYSRNHHATESRASSPEALASQSTPESTNGPSSITESAAKPESRVATKPKLVAFQLQSTPEMMNFRPGDRVDILTSIKRRDIPLVYDATVLQSNSTSCMFLVPLSESKAVSQAIAEGKNIKLVPSSTVSSSDSYRPA